MFVIIPDKFGLHHGELSYVRTNVRNSSTGAHSMYLFEVSLQKASQSASATTRTAPCIFSIYHFFCFCRRSTLVYKCLWLRVMLSAHYSATFLKTLIATTTTKITFLKPSLPPQPPKSLFEKPSLPPQPPKSQN